MALEIKNYLKEKLPESMVKKIKSWRPEMRRIYAKLRGGRSIEKMGHFMNTDKVGYHEYGKKYDRHFGEFKNDRVKILEIGIGGYEDKKSGGDSLRMWKNYFSRGKIFGIDLYEKNINTRRIQTVVCDQSKKSELKNLAKSIGELDIVIDDGSHISEHIITSFKVLFRQIKEGGWYVVEDTRTSYIKEFGGKHRGSNGKDTTMEFFKHLVDGLNYEHFENESYDPTYFDKNIKEMHFYKDIIFIKKQ